MATYRLLDGNGYAIDLTTESAASKYGLPVLSLSGHHPRMGDGDSLPDLGPSGRLGFFSAAQWVCHWARQGEDDWSQEDGAKPAPSAMLPVTEEAMALARVFCAQWPEGPQL